MDTQATTEQPQPLQQQQESNRVEILAGTLHKIFEKTIEAIKDPRSSTATPAATPTTEQPQRTRQWLEESKVLKQMYKREKEISSIKASGLRDLKQAMREFQKLQRNCYLNGSVKRPTIKKVDDEEDIPICNCDGKERKCGASDSCQNRVTQIECDPNFCHAGNNCENLRFQKGKFPEVVVRSTGERGCGLFAKQEIQKGDLVVEYRGEVISDEEMQRRLKQDYRGQRHQYMMVLSGDNGILDATVKGSIARFMNHSCEPNCYVQEWNSRGFPRMGIFANRVIKVEEELSFDYKMKRLGSMFENCRCGAPSCRGSLSIEEPGVAIPANGSSSSSNGNEENGEDREGAASRASNTSGAADSRKRARSDVGGGRKVKRKLGENEECDPITGASIKVEMDKKMCLDIGTNFFKREILNPPTSMKLAEAAKKDIQRARTFLIRNVVKFRNENIALMLE